MDMDLKLWSFLKFLLLWMHCEGWCMGWNQRCNLLPLPQGCWPKSWHYTGDEILVLYSNKIVEKMCNNDIKTMKVKGSTGGSQGGGGKGDGMILFQRQWWRNQVLKMLGYTSQGDRIRSNNILQRDWFWASVSDLLRGREPGFLRRGPAQDTPFNLILWYILNIVYLL